jgi:hypothetical protein
MNKDYLSLFFKKVSQVHGNYGFKLNKGSFNHSS